ncbi:MAG TPA: hypothetical protein ENO22_04780 [candidate division Zixibacteria bacterium]|nr:hypothetical protein [candidate division Zixibacteria bacterium]
MRIVLVIIAIVFVILLVFTAANWQVLTTVTPLSFVAFSIEGPLGVILLGVSLVLTLLVVAYALLLRTNWLMESHRLSRQLEEQRELADKAEASRITALQEMLRQEFEALTKALNATGEANTARIEAAEQSLSKIIEDTGNSITASLGYLDDKLKNSSQGKDA